MIKKLLALSVLCACSLAFTGCGNKGTDTASSSTTTEVKTPGATGAVEPVAYTNAEGKLLCPVMGTVVESPEKAVGHQDYEGKRYYFCCGGCPEKFKADPAKYAKK
ncbi:MAG: YHS domain-containing protein [Chthonomonas sp.]|nr:YHS domain-containing protein [Chthonomonas sp.]